MVDADKVHCTGEKVATTVFEEYAKAGLELHSSPNKTAMLASWNGIGRDAERVAFEESVRYVGGVKFIALGVTKVLAVAEKYKHIGSWCQDPSPAKQNKPGEHRGWK